MAGIRAYVDRLEVGEPIALEVPGVVEKLDGHITNVSRGKKGAQVIIKTNRKTSTWHLPNQVIRPRAEQR